MPPRSPRNLDDTAVTAPVAPDASRISFPLQLVILIVTTVLSVALSVTGSTWTIKSDVRDMATRLELREDAYRQDRDAMTAQLKSQASRTEMLQIDVNDLKLAIAKMSRKTE